MRFGPKQERVEFEEEPAGIATRGIADGPVLISSSRAPLFLHLFASNLCILSLP